MIGHSDVIGHKAFGDVFGHSDAIGHKAFGDVFGHMDVLGPVTRLVTVTCSVTGTSSVSKHRGKRPQGCLKISVASRSMLVMLFR